MADTLRQGPRPHCSTGPASLTSLVADGSQQVTPLWIDRR
jgi:hypothetical protein